MHEPMPPTQSPTAEATPSRRRAIPAERRSKPERHKIPAVSKGPWNAIFGTGCLMAVTAIAAMIPTATPLQELSLLILMGVGATVAISDQVGFAAWDARVFRLGGPAVIFVFVCLLGAAILHPEHVASLLSILRAGHPPPEARK
jgi:hypothetical protein